MNQYKYFILFKNYLYDEIWLDAANKEEALEAIYDMYDKKMIRKIKLISTTEIKEF